MYFTVFLFISLFSHSIHEGRFDQIAQVSKIHFILHALNAHCVRGAKVIKALEAKIARSVDWASTSLLSCDVVTWFL